MMNSSVRAHLKCIIDEKKKKKKESNLHSYFSFHSVAQQSEVIHCSDTNWLMKMIRSVFLTILTMIITNIDCSRPVGYIYNATCDSNSTTTVITYKDTCKECICYGFFSTVVPLYVGLNCYTNNKTCKLFTNYSSSTMININSDSTFIFIQLPPAQDTTTGNYIIYLDLENHDIFLWNVEKLQHNPYRITLWTMIKVLL
jgi:hypothetical protein